VVAKLNFLAAINLKDVKLLNSSVYDNNIASTFRLNMNLRKWL